MSFSRLTFSLVALLTALPAAADPLATNIGASQFTVVWSSGSADTPDVRIFADAEGTVDLTPDLRREAFPLSAPLRLHASSAERAAARDLAAETANRSLRAVRVSLAPGDTQVYVQTGTRSENGFTPDAHPLLAVRTAPVTPFAAAYPVVAIEFDSADLGSHALLRVDGARAPLLATVGDGVGGLPIALFPLARLIDSATGGPLATGDTLAVEITHIRGPGDERSMAATVGIDPLFAVATLTRRTFEVSMDVPVAFFQFDPVDDQMAAQPFSVRLTARTSEGDIVADFDGTATLDSDGRLESGSLTAPFSNGVLDTHTVVIGNTGDFVLAASLPGGGATGLSNEFIVRTDWENYASLFGDPAEPRPTQRLADPGSVGVPALARYAFDLDPAQPQLAAAKFVDEVLDDADDRFARVTFRRLRHAPDVRYVVDASGDLDTWETLAVLAPGTPEWVTVQDEVPLRDAGGRFLRVAVIGDGGFDFWRVNEFPPAFLADTALTGPESDPDSLGVTNRTRYALGMSGLDPDLTRLPVRTVIEENGQTFQQLTFPRIPDAFDIEYIVEVTTDFPNWETVAILSPGTPEEVTVTDSAPLPATGYRIMRLRIQSPTAP